jgi:hypothetical protein
MNADIVVWMDTLKEGRFEDTNRLFVPPKNYDYRVTDWTDVWLKTINDLDFYQKSLYNS